MRRDLYDTPPTRPERMGGEDDYPTSRFHFPGLTQSEEWFYPEVRGFNFPESPSDVNKVL